MIRHLFEALCYWKRNKHFTELDQRMYLLRTVQADHRWLGHNDIATELTERYMKLLSDNWHKLSTEDVAAFRERIGLSPHYNQQVTEKPTKDVPWTDSDLSLYLEMGAPSSFRNISVDDLDCVLRHFLERPHD